MDKTQREERVVKLISDLQKPVFVFNMANACLDRPGAALRRSNALKQIDRLVREYGP